MGETAGKSLGVVVLGHGSRSSGAAKALERLTGQLEKKLGCTVMPASLQFNRPTLADSCRELAAQGVTIIVIAPYFLFNGNHLQKDIPNEIEAIRSELPHVELILAEHLGEDQSLVELLERRVVAAADGSSWNLTNEGNGNLDEDEQSLTDGGYAINAEDSAAKLSQPRAIEAESFAIIDSMLKPADPCNPNYQVSRRVVHATGDPELAEALSFSAGAIKAGLAAVSDSADIWCDVNMVASGIGPTAKRMGLTVTCAIDDRRAAAIARRQGITRAAAALRMMAAEGSGRKLIIAIGNAPTALFECLRLHQEGSLQPALVVGVPVGFVGAAESKLALAASDLRHITLRGCRGGSNVAVAIVNALLKMAGDRK